MYSKLLLDHAGEWYRTTRSIYRRTRSTLKITSTPTEAKQTGYMNDQSPESEKAKFHNPAIPNTVRVCVKENSLEKVSPDPVQSTLPS